MKIRFVFLLLIVFLLNSCSAQNKMNPKIFFDRLSSINKSVEYEIFDSFNDDNKSVYFIKDKKGTDYIFDFETNADGDINKISLVCNEKDKAEDFICLAQNTVSVYTPHENGEEILGALTQKDLSYYDTKWHSWFFYSDENGLFFSVINNDMKEPEKVEFSLKPNDKTDF